MDPITLAIAALTAAAIAGVVDALSRFVGAVLSREERAGRSLREIIRDAIKGSPESAPPEPALEERIANLGKVMTASATLLEQITAEIELRAASPVQAAPGRFVGDLLRDADAHAFRAKLDQVRWHRLHVPLRSAPADRQDEPTTLAGIPCSR